ncbi:hypothetical protein IG631_19968 [Alternaria alternata]|nr:hypothetical protein IG631_19968 [Alternaria alternata]
MQPALLSILSADPDQQLRTGDPGRKDVSNPGGADDSIGFQVASISHKKASLSDGLDGSGDHTDVI